LIGRLERHPGYKNLALAINDFMLHALSVFTAIFPGESRLAGFIGAKDDEGGGDNWSCKSCIAPVKSSPRTNQHPTFSASENVRTILHADADASQTTE